MIVSYHKRGRRSSEEDRRPSVDTSCLTEYDDTFGRRARALRGIAVCTNVSAVAELKELLPIGGLELVFLQENSRRHVAPCAIDVDLQLWITSGFQLGMAPAAWSAIAVRTMAFVLPEEFWIELLVEFVELFMPESEISDMRLILSQSRRAHTE